MNRAKNQTGFAAIEAVLIVVVLAIIGFTGYFVYHSRQAANKDLSSANAASTAPTAQGSASFMACKKAADSTLRQTYPEQCVTKAGKTFTDTSQNSLVVKEWGVKIVFADADKVTYKLSTTSTGTQDVALLLKSSVRSIAGCQDLGVGFQRDPNSSDLSYAQNDKQTVAGHVYVLVGAPGACDDGTANSDSAVSQLRSKIDSQELGKAQYVIEATN